MTWSMEKWVSVSDNTPEFLELVSRLSDPADTPLRVRAVRRLADHIMQPGPMLRGEYDNSLSGPYPGAGPLVGTLAGQLCILEMRLNLAIRGLSAEIKALWYTDLKRRPFVRAVVRTSDACSVRRARTLKFQVREYEEELDALRACVSRQILEHPGYVDLSDI